MFCSRMGHTSSLCGSGASSLDEFVSHVVAAADGVLIDAVVDAILNNEIGT